MSPGFPDFRLGSVLATSFTATLTERHGDSVERIPVPHRLVDWLAVTGLEVDSCTTGELDLARELRRRSTPPRQRQRSRKHFQRLPSRSSTSTVPGDDRWPL